VGDLDALLARMEPDAPANLLGHSLGGNVAMLYAGIRPARVARLVNLEGVGLPATRAEQAPRRYARWLDELRDPPGLKSYASFAALADRLQQGNRRLSRERAEFLARHWGRETEAGSVVLRGDAGHKIVNPVLYRYEEVRACWQQISAPVLWIDAAESDTLGRLGIDAAQYAERRSAIKDLTYRVVEQSGHMLHHDQPEAVARLVETFFSA
jgi:pimeloyl-ACP methyl ester carboxylesterase